MNILNLYSGIGGNRKLWPDSYHITAVEHRRDIANVYAHYFPNDKLVIADAHQFLLNHYTEFDLIWSSPPCQTHSRSRYWRHSTLSDQAYPDLSLYQELLFLKNFYRGKWVVENVDPFYEPLIRPTQTIGRHVFWANFRIGNYEPVNDLITEGKRDDWRTLYGFDLNKFKLNTRKDQIYRNCVHPKTGEYILDCATGAIMAKAAQGTLFENDIFTIDRAADLLQNLGDTAAAMCFGLNERWKLAK